MIQIKKITKQAEFAELEKEWGELLKSAESQSVFLTWEWNYSWWEAFGEKYELFVIAIFDDKELIGIAPLYKERSFFFKRLRFISDQNNISRELGFVLKKDREEEILKKIKDFLEKEKSWDMLYWFGAIDSLHAFQFWHDLFDDKKIFLRQIKGKYSGVELDDWDKYITTLRPRQRSKVRSLLKKYVEAEEREELEFVVTREKADLENQFLSFIDLHQKRWNKKNKPGMFGEAGYTQFMKNVSSRLLANDELFFCHLKYQRRYIAHQLCVQKNNVVHLINEAYDEEFKSFSAGNMLRTVAFKYLCEQGVVYDFLNNYSFHKKSWGATPANQYHLEIGKKSVKNYFYFGYFSVRRKIIKLLPNSLVEIKGKIECRVRDFLKYIKYNNGR